MTQDDRQELIDVLDKLMDEGYTIRHPVIKLICEALGTGPDWQEDGE
jgi:hypothetical protein